MLSTSSVVGMSVHAREGFLASRHEDDVTAFGHDRSLPVEDVNASFATDIVALWTGDPDNSLRDYSVRSRSVATEFLMS